MRERVYLLVLHQKPNRNSIYRQTQLIIIN